MLGCRTREMVILGTQYAGEMKKGIFSVMHYLMPKRGILSLHSGCNVGANEDVSLFFGLSGALPWPTISLLWRQLNRRRCLSRTIWSGQCCILPCVRIPYTVA